MRHFDRAVRAVSWGEGNQLFATAADPFHTREVGAISIFEFPSQEVLSTGKLAVKTLLKFKNDCFVCMQSNSSPNSHCSVFFIFQRQM